MIDLLRLQGTWAIAALETDGHAIPASMFHASKIIVDGDRFTTRSMGATFSGNVRLDTTVSPMTIDLLFTDGPHQGTASLGIFRFDGDTWTICLGFAGVGRPTAFRTTAGSGHALETLRREAATSEVAGRAQPAPVQSASQQAASQDEMARLGGTWSATSIASNGAPLPDTFVKSGKRVVIGNELTVTVAGQVQLHVTFTVNPATTPKSIDYVIMDGPARGSVMPGIYEWRGDTLRTCFVQPGQPRPNAFETHPGDNRTLSEWMRRAP